MTEQKENTIDIVALVENNPIIRLPGNNKLEIITKIKDKFKNEEEQLFVANFYCYLNCNSRNDYVIDIDKIWKWLGFGKKSDCKSLLVNNFKEYEDYKVEKAAAANSAAAFNQQDTDCSVICEKNLGGAGQNKESILMTIYCFKKLCLKAKTKKSDEIHDYYIKLEEIMNEIIYAQADDLVKKLTIKDAQIDKTLKDNEKNLILNFENKQVVYLIQINETEEKFGFAKDVKNRLSQHRAEFGPDIKLRVIFETVYNREFETMIKKDSIISPHIISKKYKTNQTEIIKIDENFTREMLDSRLEELKKNINGDLILNLMKENDQLKKELAAKSVYVPIFTNPDDRFLYIEFNETGKDLYKISSTVSEIKRENIKFTYQSKNSPQIIDFVKILLRPYNKDIEDWIPIVYKKIKQILDFAIMVYDMYKITPNPKHFGTPIFKNLNIY